MQRPVVIEVPAAMSSVDLLRLGAHVERLFRQGRRVICEVQGSDLTVVDALARLHLLARRCDGALQVRGSEADELLRLAGLSDVCGPDVCRSEVGGKPEALEQRGVEEVVDVGDPSA